MTGGAPVTAEHIDKLVLTQQVLKESMRVYPPVPMLSRQAIADITIGGHAIKAGTSIVMPIYAIHRHHKRWRDPDVFDPTRFAPENEAGISRYQYLPFGAGPRICIGMAFAMIEATAMLATLLQSASFEPVAGHEPTPIARVTLHPKGRHAAQGVGRLSASVRALLRLAQPGQAAPSQTSPAAWDAP